MPGLGTEIDLQVGCLEAPETVEGRIRGGRVVIDVGHGERALVELGRSYQRGGDILVRDDLDTVVGELILVGNLQHLVDRGHVGVRVKGVDDWEVDARELICGIYAISKEKETSREGVERWGEGAGVVKLGGLVKGDARWGRVEELELEEL